MKNTKSIKTKRLPYPAELTPTDGIISAPGDSFITNFVADDVKVDVQAPVISGWNKTVHPGESLIITGIRFTLLDNEKQGSDTTVWLWVDTPEGGELHQVNLWRVEESIITATLPENIPFGMYLIWVENKKRISEPVALNRTQAQWLGPLGNIASQGQSKRVFGKNLATVHGNSDSNVYLKEDSGEFIACEILKVEPYSVEFKVPEELSEDKYQVYVHNGHGGEFGWSSPLELLIDTWQRGDTEIVISPSDDDVTTIQEAIEQLSAKTDGGTVRLTEGEFTLHHSLDVKSKVCLTGSGKDKTILKAGEELIQPVVVKKPWEIDDKTILQGGDVFIQSRTAVENMTLKQMSINARDKIEDVRIANIKIIDQQELTTISIKIRGARIEITGSEVATVDSEKGENASFNSDNWIHNNIFTGEHLYSHAGIFPYGERGVIEKNHFKNEWPVGSDGEKRMESSSYIPREHGCQGPASENTWMSRMLLTGGRGTKPRMNHHYIAHNTTKNVTVEQNNGEMILFHGGWGSWFGKVKKNQDNTMTVSTDVLTLNGEKIILENRWNELESGGTVKADIGDYVIINGGTGIGQARKIVDYTEDTITVEKPWRVEPDSDSFVTITHLFVDNIVYKNDLIGFPEGYKLTVWSANRGVAFYGNSWDNVAEGNISRRTNLGSDIVGLPTSPSFWNELRNEKNLNIYSRGISISGTATKAPGALTLGNIFRGCVVEITGETTNPLLSNSAPSKSSSNIFENIKAIGTTVTGISSGKFSQALFRNNEIILKSSEKLEDEEKKVGITIDKSSLPILSGNSYQVARDIYSGDDLTYQPVALHRVVHFIGKVEEELDKVIVPIVNTGVETMLWEANTNKDWITVEGGSELKPEAKGELSVKVDSSGLEAGIYWGSVILTAGKEKVIIGVRLELVK